MVLRVDSPFGLLRLGAPAAPGVIEPIHQRGTKGDRAYNLGDREET